MKGKTQKNRITGKRRYFRKHSRTAKTKKDYFLGGGRVISCDEGIAFMSLCENNSKILIAGSLTNSSFWELPPSFVVDITKYRLDPNNEDLHNNSIEDYKRDCELKVDIISNNSICLRLYKKDDRNGAEDDIIGFHIDEDELLKIAKKYLTR